MAQTLITWETRFAVGVKIIDEQHKKLIDIINDLYIGSCNALEIQSPEENEKAFKTAISAAVEYIQVHFTTEEKLMAEYNYPEYSAHKSKHEDFVQQVRQTVNRFETGYPQVTMAFVSFLRDWLLEHIVITDKVLATYLRNKGVQ